MSQSETERPSFFGPLPTRGIWTAVGLSRSQFLLILGISIVLFVFIGGPAWLHLRDSHFLRITLSYTAIPPLVAAALYRNHALRWGPLLAGSGVIALIKLVATALILIVFAIAMR